VIYHPKWFAEQRPGAPAVIMGSSGQVLTYAQLQERSSRLGRLLQAAGLHVGHHLAILMDNSVEFLEVAWAAQRSGLYYTAINSHLRAAEVQYILDDCGAQALVASASLGDVVSRLDLSRLQLRLMVGGRVSAGFEGYAERLASVAVEDGQAETEGREMLYSGGTTGRPKGVRKELVPTGLGDPAAPVVQTAINLDRIGLGTGTVYLSPAPLYHAAPLVYCMSLHRLGGTVVVMERFDAAHCLQLIERYGVTHAQFVPTMFVRLLQLPEAERRRYDLTSLRYVVHAAAPCPVEVKRQMLAWWGPIIHEYYSGTEDIGSTFITPQEWLAHPGSVGRPLTEIHIVGPEGDELPVGEPGAVYFAGGRRFEYHNDPDKTASMTNDRGWRTLGDIGYLDGDGYLYLTDRQAHMIISGGVNIYPQETEDVLILHPAVVDVAVIGVPDEDMGEVVKAVVQLADPESGSSGLEGELVAWCQERLASYKCPRSVDFDPALPRDPSGKLYKRLLRDRYS
jgi:long-chain acyl-CoA synthetase